MTNLPVLDFLDPASLDFSGFTGRDEGIAGVYRYKIYPVSWYRSNLVEHSRRVLYLLQAALPRIREVFPQADTRRMQTMCLVHDDAEIFTGDFQSVDYERLTAAELAGLADGEERAIDYMERIYPREIGGYAYAELLREVLRKDTLEAQVVKFFDHLDGFGEGLHEVYAGNICFVTPVVTEYGPAKLPHDYYLGRFADGAKKYPLITGLFEASELPFLRDFGRVDFDAACASGRPHTPENILESSGHEYYDWWKKTVWESGDEIVRRRLVERSPRVTLD